MGGKRRIDVETIKLALGVLVDFNRLDLGEIEFYRGGEPLEVPKAVIDRFRITGLSNKDFISLGFYDPTDPDADGYAVEMFGSRREAN